MIGIVLVSHSEALAKAARDLALQMVHETQPPIRIAAGATGGFGTDATAIAAAIDELADTDGVLLITDLGSAVLSSSLALDLRESTHPVVISDGPFVEATTAAVVGAAAGATLKVIAADASNALDAKKTQPVTGPTGTPSAPASNDHQASAEERLMNPMGLHARPAALLVQTAGKFSAEIELTNTTAGRGPVDASSVIGILSLAASKNDQIRIDANGPDAPQAVNAVKQLVLQGFGELS
ncbi:HPr family phosphocarrier protein [Pseudarthrobacter sp. HLT3-5]|uniref:HPr family phosphocarrier protein n=1 Tax=Pseudarthrobacter cellobiosi TaxID=2953654 RepID=UPI00208F7D9A|nr:HPr family phosphocarrier protein [Pseudarthrobacter sp. HLT3-5]MCO4276019.1 HPr family phosphocarrier protein [Pseudarthrobacter sp. HLT3-5]